ncbi:heparinase II/III domain-containing protein [Parabacteroides faecis]|uniref:heparinase II/III domain-containing protein n=1 Tax=Parabacteroides faecis TaxID=1217282 RepID=UPI003523078A
MNKAALLVVFCMTLFVPVCAQGIHFDSYPSHPRLLVKQGEEQKIKSGLAHNPEILRLHEYLLRQCDAFAMKPMLTYKKEGKRLLAVSREALRRIFYLSYAYRMTGEEKYLLRAEQEMIAVCSFDDWNPSHFLDTGEMTMAVALGYDWLFDKLSTDTRKLVKEAILNKGFAPSRDKRYNWFLSESNNWNQVCNAGLVYGALAVLEDHPGEAREIIERALSTVGLTLKGYAPDGAYPEGYNYWGYGTTFQVLMNAALESALGSDGGLSEAEGFLASARFMQFMTGTTGKCFNFSDSRESVFALPAMYWFADKLQDPSLLWNEKDILSRAELSFSDEENRFLPLIPIYGSQYKMKELMPPATKLWVGNGQTPVVLIRTGWQDGEGFYLGIKGGTASTSHAHMDAGSFVFDALGVRWVQDLGMQEYYSLEKENVDLWNSSQEGQRWDVFRYNNLAHSTLTVNGKYHRVKGFVPVTNIYSDDHKLGASLEMTELFGGDLKSAVREVALINEKYLSVTDRVQADDQPASVRWTIVTGAVPRVLDSHMVELKKDGKCMQLIVDSPSATAVSILDNVSKNSYDAPNEGTYRVVLDVNLESGQEKEIKVRLVPATDR